MSYAEHGSRIFLTGKLNSNPLLRYGDYVVTKKRSEGRLKLFDSCSDLRAWSPNALDNFRHFREIVENRTPSGRIVPYDVLIETLIILGQKKLASVRRQLERYKSLPLTPEQKKQLQDIEYSTEERNKTSDSTLPLDTRIVEDDSGVPKRPGTPIQSISSSSSTYFHDIEIDNDFSADNNSELSQEIFVSSQIYDDIDRSNDRLRRDESRSGKRSRTYESDDNQRIIIKKDSEIIALNHELAAKDAHLEEIKEIYRNLESSMNQKTKKLKISQEKLSEMLEEKEEWMKKMDRLKITLAEKIQECCLRNQEIQEFRKISQETETLRKDRDSLARKLEEMSMVQCERNELSEVNKEQAVSLADQEDEINRLLSLNQNTLLKYDEKERELRHLRSVLEAKNSDISQYETHRDTQKTEISPTGSLSQVQTWYVQKLQLTLREDLRAVEEELSRRHENHYFQYEKIYSTSNNTRDQTNEMIGHENWNREKYFELSKDSMDRDIEQLTVQLSATNATNEDKDAIDEIILGEIENSKETIRRLVAELEPYVKERLYLFDEIKRLKEAVEDAQRYSETRDLKMQKQYLSEIVNNHRKECEGYTKKIDNLEKLIEEKIHREQNDHAMDEEIDKALALHVKRSIEEMTKLSAGLRGAGDEMAKIRDEVEIRETEISKLRQQVDIHASRGQGDEANNENLKEIVRLKMEKKRLIEDSKNQRESLRMIKDKLQSREFELKGLKRQKTDISAEYECEIQKKTKQIEGLAKENEGLNKTVLIINDWVMKSDAMKINLESLQDENSKLTEEKTTMLKRCEDYKNRVVDFANREIGTKESHDRDVFELQERATRNEILMKKLRDENEALIEQSRRNKSEIEKLTSNIQVLREDKKNLDLMENVWTEMSKLNDDRQRLDDKVTRLRYNLENHHRTNDKLEDQLKWKIHENEILRNALKELNENNERMTNVEMNEESVKNLLRTLPNKICEKVEKLREQMDNTRIEDLTWQSEINAMRAKSLEDDSMIEKLRDEIQLLKNKIDQRDKKIITLENDRANLKEKLKESQTRENTAENKLQPDYENEIRSREMDIMRLARDVEMKNEELRNLNELVETLTRERSELSGELRNEKDLRQTRLSELQQMHTASMKDFNDKHNDRIGKLLAQQEEFTKNTGDPFDWETWLRSLTMKEMAELQKRICASNPCEIIGEASKTRALNDKQNQQLQQDEKLLAGKIHRTNGLHNDPTNGFPYAYERRKFESAKHKPVEKSFNNNTFDAQRKIFFHQCAINHKYDSN